MASEHVQSAAIEPAALPVSYGHFAAAAANPMLAGTIAAQQPQPTGNTAAATLLPLTGGLPGVAAAAGGPHLNPSTGHCPAVFVANISHIGSDRDLKDLFNKFVALFLSLSLASHFSEPSASKI